MRRDNMAVIIDLNSLIQAMINGIFVGGGAALGTYLVTKHLIKNIERIEAKLKNGNGKKETE
jgi:hypothetical protein